MGFSTDKSSFPLFGDATQNTLSFNSTYFTLKQGTCAFIDQYPAQLNDYALLLGDTYYYMPIVPTQVHAIDWQQSKIEIKNNTGVTDDMVFQFDLYWYSPDC